MKRHIVVPAVVMAMVLTASSVLPGDRASGTPLYSARAGRTCDNCHLDPGQWENPRVSERKCTLSCQGCHVDPSGGGARNVSGRFYGASTLPAIATQPRPTRDWDRELMAMFYRRDKATVYNDRFPRGPGTPDQQFQPEYAPSDRWAWGDPAGDGNRYSLTQGRYGNLHADPLFRLGWDLRAAALLGRGSRVFPMQLDLGLTIHPVEHLTFLFNVGARGRTEGIGALVDDPRTPYLREGFLLLHELPWGATLKAGRFTPSYGLRLDDHTAFTRRGLELDLALPETRVTGVEVGLNPNYPFVQASWFRSKALGVAPAAFDPFDVDQAWGGALNLGFRELGWSVGASSMIRRRDLDEGGDRTLWGVYGSFNPWYYRQSLPLTYQVEVDRGEYQRGGGTLAQQAAFWQEIDWQVANGLNLMLGHTWEDPDRAVIHDEAHRVHAGFQFTPVTGITVDGRLRVLGPSRAAESTTRIGDVFDIRVGGSPTAADYFLQIHFWN